MRFECDALPVAGGGGGELLGEFFADFFLDGGVKSERSAGGDASLVGHISVVRSAAKHKPKVINTTASCEIDDRVAERALLEERVLVIRHYFDKGAI